MTERSRFCFPKRMRLAHDREFRAVFDAQVRKNVEPLVVYGRPNDLGHARLGLSVPRRVGTAVVRHRIKRLVREAFRLGQHAFPGAYDVVVVVRPHLPRRLSDYAAALDGAFRSLHLQWSQRSKPSQSSPDGAGSRPAG